MPKYFFLNSKNHLRNIFTTKILYIFFFKLTYFRLMRPQILWVHLSPPSYPFSGRLKYFPIQNKYHQQRNVKCGTSGKYLIFEVLRNQTLLLLVYPEEIVGILKLRYLGGERYDQCDGPYYYYHYSYSVAISCVDIIYVSYGPIPVK